jgi:hypothetical protein
VDVSEMLEDMQRRGVIDVRQPLLLLLPRPEEEKGPALLRRLQKTKRRHKEGLFPTSRIGDTVNTQAVGKWLSTLDLKSGYWQVDLHPDDKENTAFSALDG